MTYSRKLSRFKGYTLVELLVSVGIIVLMLAVSLPAFTAFQRQQQLKLAAEQVRDAVIEAQHYALAPRSNEDGSAGKPDKADFYRTLFFTNNSYEIDEQTADVSGQVSSDADTAAFATVLRSGVLPPGVVFCNFSTPRLAVFSGETPGIFPSKGLIYSISSSGRLVKPATIGQFKIVVRHTGIRDTKKSIEIQAETGRVTINDTNEQCSL